MNKRLKVISDLGRISDTDAAANSRAAEEPDQSLPVGWAFLIEIQGNARSVSSGLYNEGERCSGFNEYIVSSTRHRRIEPFR
jgi:hypothetical protein